MSEDEYKKTEETIFYLASVCMTLGMVNRATRHPDGKTFETDTTHTVMVAVIACSLASRFTDLNVGLIAELALAHDFPEAYAGDTDTRQGLSENQKTEKKEREKIAMEMIADKTKEMPWLPDCIHMYEDRNRAETDFIWVVDKIVPKLTHIMNGCKVVPSLSDNGYHQEQRLSVQRRTSQWPWMLALDYTFVARTVKIQTELEERRKTKSNLDDIKKLVGQIYWTHPDHDDLKELQKLLNEVL